MASITVSVSDFPVYDGSSSPEGFVRQCKRLATLGGIPDATLSSILVARCRGLALQVVESAAASDDVEATLREAFGRSPPELAAEKLSCVRKGTMPVLEYSLLIQGLVKKACPEFFDGDEAVKKICVPAYSAALFRHFLVGLSLDERRLLSRQGCTTFDDAVKELVREESFSDSQLAAAHWTECAAADPGDRRQHPRSPSARQAAVSFCRDDVSQRHRSPSPPRWEPAPGRRGWSEDARRQRDATAAGGSSGHISGRSPGRPWRPRDDLGPSSSTRRGSRPEPAPGRVPRARSGSAPREDIRPQRNTGQREPQCWLCRGFGHLKRECPNGRGGRSATDW